MKSILYSFLALMMVVTAAGQEAVEELEPKSAVKLIASLNDVREKPIAIASIISGTKAEGEFVASHVRRVTAILPVNDNGSQVRRVRCYDFFWNETYGWFVYEKRTGRGGDEIWIWSESCGDIVIK